jgi:hypothetical protein
MNILYFRDFKFNIFASSLLNAFYYNHKVFIYIFTDLRGIALDIYHLLPECVKILVYYFPPLHNPALLCCVDCPIPCLFMDFHADVERCLQS